MGSTVWNRVPTSPSRTTPRQARFNAIVHALLGAFDSHHELAPWQLAVSINESELTIGGIIAYVNTMFHPAIISSLKINGVPHYRRTLAGNQIYAQLSREVS